MLSQRLLTTAVLLPLFVWIIFVLPTYYFAVATAFVILIAAWEWTGLIGIASQYSRLAYLALMTGAMIGVAWLATLPGMPQTIMVIAILWWLASLFWIRRFSLNSMISGRPVAAPDSRYPFYPRWLFGMLGIVVLVPAWLALMITHGSIAGSAFVMLFMLLVWGADSGAYIAGRIWGRTRLAPQVSPGKTWEGVYGALLVALAVAVGAGLWFGYGWKAQVTLVLLGFITVLFSIVGDLFESLIKRLAGVKDSGRLLPGHGGMLDRIDSITAAAPIFAMGLMWQGWVL